MDLVVLQGKSNSGKTTALKHLMLKLLKQKGIEVLWVTRLKRSISPEELTAKIQDGWKMKSGAISDTSIAVKYNGKIIGITSFGDSLQNQILPALERVKNACEDKCDIFVCGRHTCNDLKNEFARYKPKQVVVIDKPRSSDPTEREKDNLAASEDLFRAITDLCK